ncbi:hypothetical protein J4463_01955 [Candidatus Pacearchaeota archaeon]|nr:hypothetical protein [Candidatus Pacearchaeota archaeon]
MHTTRSSTSKTWPIARKGTKYVIVPSHNKKTGIPLLIVLRDVLNAVKTRKELKKAIYEKKIIVNGKIVRDDKCTLVLFDVISIPSEKKHYRIFISENKKISVEEISEKESAFKTAKAIGKILLKKAVVQINLSDGRNLISNEKISTGDSVLIRLSDNKIEKILSEKNGSEILVIKGKYMGKKGIIKEINSTEVIVNSEGKDIKIKSEELIVVK